MRSRNTYIIAAALAVMALTGCANLSGTAAGLSELEKGKLTYVLLADEWSALKERAVELRTSGTLTDTDWAIFATDQLELRRLSQEARMLRTQWEQTGVKPQNWDATLAGMKFTIDRTAGVLGGYK